MNVYSDKSPVRLSKYPESTVPPELDVSPEFVFAKRKQFLKQIRDLRNVNLETKRQVNFS